MVAAILEEMRGVDPHARVDGRGHARARGGQARRDPGQDRLPGPVAHWVGARDRPHVLRREPAQREPLRARPPAGEDHRAGRPRRVGGARPHRQRLLPPGAERDRRARRHPAAAAVRRRGRRRRQLRRHRHGHRARDHPRLRRPGPALRRRRRAARVVDDGGRGALHRAGRPAGRAVRRLHRARRRAGQRPPHAGREHRRPRRARAGPARPRAGRRRHAVDRRADARAAVLPGQRDAVAGEHQPGSPAHAGGDRSAQPAPSCGCRPDLEPRGLPRRVRPARRRADHAPAGGADRDLVTRGVTSSRSWAPPRCRRGTAGGRCAVPRSPVQRL